MKGVESNQRPLPVAHVVGVGRSDPGLDRERSAVGDDIHQFLPGRDDSATGEDGQADHCARGRGTDLGPRELIARRIPAWADIGQRGFHLSQFGRDPLEVAALSLEHLKTGLARLASRLGDRCGILTALSPKFGPGPFKRPDPVLGDEALFGDGLQAFELLVDQAQLFVDRRDLAAVALAGTGGLGGSLPDYSSLRRQQGRAGSKLTALELECPEGVEPVGAVQGGKFGWWGDDGLAGLLGGEAGALGEQCNRLRRERAFLRADVDGGEPEENFALANLLAFANGNVGNHSAFAMLDGLALAGDRELARCNGGGIEPSDGCPAEQDDEEQHRDDQPEANIAGRIGAAIDGSGPRFGGQGTTREHRRIGIAGEAFDLSGHCTATRGPAWRSASITSSRGPYMATRPSRRTRSLSTTGSRLSRCATTNMVVPVAFNCSRVVIS